LKKDSIVVAKSLSVNRVRLLFLSRRREGATKGRQAGFPLAGFLGAFARAFFARVTGTNRMREGRRAPPGARFRQLHHLAIAVLGLPETVPQSRSR
jgi:hypothetical protein